MEVIEKIPAPVLVTSNPFDILENCSFIEPTEAFPFPPLPPSPSHPLSTSDLAQLPSSSHPAGISLEVDLAPHTKKKKIQTQEQKCSLLLSSQD